MKKKYIQKDIFKYIEVIHWGDYLSSVASLKVNYRIKTSKNPVDNHYVAIDEDNNAMVDF